jgi:hypothetical protein
MHLRLEYACLSHWHCGNFKLECCYVAFLMRMHAKPIAKCRIHFVQVRPSILLKQLSNMKTVLFWSVTPCSLKDDRTWFRENLSLKWATDSTERSTHKCFQHMWLCFMSLFHISSFTLHVSGLHRPIIGGILICCFYATIWFQTGVEGRKYIFSSMKYNLWHSSC